MALIRIMAKELFHSTNTISYPSVEHELFINERNNNLFLKKKVKGKTKQKACVEGEYYRIEINIFTVHQIPLDWNERKS